MRKFMGLVLALLVMAGIALAGTTSAQAAGRDGVLNEGEFVQFYAGGHYGACTDDWDGVPQYIDQPLLNCGTGTQGVGTPVKNNTESYVNLDYELTAHVCTKGWWSGSCFNVPPRTMSVYSSRYKDNVESFQWR